MRDSSKYSWWASALLSVKMVLFKLFFHPKGGRNTPVEGSVCKRVLRDPETLNAVPLIEGRGLWGPRDFLREFLF